MKKIFPPLFLLNALLALLLCPIAARADKDDAPAKPATEAKDSKESKDAEKEPVLMVDDTGNIVFHLEDELQQRAGITSAEVIATNLPAEVKSYGRVVDPSALVGLVNELAVAQSSLSASSNELARLKKLSESGNASARAIQTAEAAALHDSLAVQSAKDRVLLSYGRDFAERSDLAELSKALGSADVALIRAELPAAQTLESSPKSARIFALSGKPISAEGLGPSLSVDPMTQSKAWLFLVKTNEALLLPGEFVTAFLQTGKGATAGFAIPSSAVIRADGKPWIYIVKDEDHLWRIEVTLDVPLDGSWFVKDLVKEGERIITVGAQAAYSEEVKGSLSGD